MKGVKLVRAGATIYFVLFLVFVTWPGFTPFNRPLPLVLGLPFNMAVIALWVGFGAVVLFVLDRSEERYRGTGPAGDAPGRSGGDSRNGGAG